VDSWQFYDLPFGAVLTARDEREAVAETRRQLARAVERQLVSDVPLGAFLSGGLDSSAVVALAQEAQGSEKLQCFTIGFRERASETEGMAEDLRYARIVAQHLGVDLHTVWVGPEMVDELSTMIFHLDEPQADPAPINVYFITQLARRQGIKVLLSGTGGDDVFTGYRRHRALVMERYWAWLPPAVRRAVARTSAGLRPTTLLRRRISKALRYADLAGDERLASYFYWIPPSSLAPVLSPEVSDRLADAGPGPVHDALAKLPPDVPPLHRMLYLECKFFLTDHNLNYVDKMSMANGVEVRVPFLDPELMAFVASLPLRYKQRGRTGKYVLRKAMEPILPRQAIYRAKTGFGAPLRHWLHGALRPVVDDVLSARSLEQRGLFDARGVQRLVDMDQRREEDATYTIFSLICVELWCRMFLDRSGTLAATASATH
jgi:asparagine synthase (glutamine-hydrolysing)